MNKIFLEKNSRECVTELNSMTGKTAEIKSYSQMFPLA
jgi:hypothetical protein